MLREGAEGYSILKNYRKDGSSFWNFIQFAPMKDVNGQITLIVALQCEVSSPYLEDQDRDQVNEYEQQPNYNEFTASSTDNEQQRQEELRYQHNSRPPRYNSLTESKSLHSSTSCHPIIDSYTGVHSGGGSSGGGYHNSSAPSSHTGSSSSGGHTSHDEQGSSSDNNSGSGNGSDSQSGSRNGSQQGDGPQDQCDRDSDEGGSNNGGGTHTFLWSHHHPPSDCTTINKCDNDDISSNQQPNMWDTSSPSSSTKDNDSM